MKWPQDFGYIWEQTQLGLDVGLTRSPKKCTMVHVRSEVPVSENLRWYWMRWPGYQALRKGSSSSSQAWLRVLCRTINWPWSSHLKSTSKGYQSFGQSPCLASVWLSFVDTTLGDNNIEEIDRTRQDCCWGWRKVPLWLKCDILPTTREGGRGLRWVEM